MGEEKLDPKILQATQKSLGRIIKKPPLTEKLLSRPPFKYIHDIVTAVIKDTGFMQGLFTSDEMVNENVKEKDAKIQFLDKLIRMVSLVVNKNLSVKSKSILAGKEADKTNELLQELAAAIGKNVNNDEYVTRVKNGETVSGGKDKSKQGSDKENQGEGKTNNDDTKKERSDKRDRSKDRDPKNKDKEKNGKDRDVKEEKDKDRDRDKDKDRDRKKDRERGDRDKEKERDRGDKDKERERSSKDKERDRGDRDKEKDRGGKDKEKDRDRDRDRDKEKSRDKTKDKDQSKEKEKPKEEDKKEEPDAPTGSPSRSLTRPSSAKGNRRLNEGRRTNAVDHHSHQDEEASRTKEERTGSAGKPPSSRPAPPKPRIDSAGTTTGPDPSGSKKVSGVIIERPDKGEESDDSDQFVIEEAPPLDLGGSSRREGLEDEPEDETAHGGLVSKMLQSKKEAVADANQESGATQIQTSDPARKRERVAVEKEVAKLRSSLQTLTRSANPLGAALDFLAEDVEGMQRELQHWSGQTHETRAELKTGAAASEAGLSGLRNQLKELEDAERDWHARIATVKANVLRNEERISRMLSAVTSAS